MKLDIAQELHDLAERDDVDEPTRETAAKLAGYEANRVTQRADRYSPDDVHPVDDEWRELFDEVTAEGTKRAADMTIVVCGMARNIAGVLPVTFHRIGEIVKNFGDYGVVVIENDSTDGTKQVLDKFEKENPGHVICDCQNYGWKHLHGFEPERVERYAMLRNKYREIARDHWPHADAVLCVDLDCWGGWSVPGLLNGIGWLHRYKSAACMSSISLFEHHFFADGAAWGHYDTWALRVHGWEEGIKPWKSLWLPPAGSLPVNVYSGFGAAALYRPAAFYAHEYSSDSGDIEHAGLHRSMIADGWDIYLNPSQRSLMVWLTDDADARKHDGD